MKGITLFCLFGGFVLVYSQHEKIKYDLKDAQIHFEQFIHKFDKQYASKEEKEYRFSVFKKNLIEINELNENNPYAWFSITSMSDLGKEEFRKMYTGFVFNESVSDNCQKLMDNDIIQVQAPENFDWREKNVITPVKNQGTCGSCWSFSTTGNIESMNAIKSGQIATVSEQQLVDCNLENLGCDGGFPSVALSYVTAAGGIMSEQDYPYAGARQSCRFDQNRAVIKISGCKSYNLQDEEKLRDLLYSNGPLSIVLCGDTLMQHYKGGIANTCCQELNHAVLLVGFGVENGVPFWTIKNSWGQIFGEKGYFRILRGSNMCSLLNPLMATAVI